MNWTEGALARHSRRRGWDEDAARQKRYFATARARARTPLRHGPQATANRAAAFVPNYIPLHQSSGKHPKSPGCDKPHIPLQLRRQGNNGSPHLPSEGFDMEAKRRRLLEKSDWSGIGLQEPLVVDYADLTWADDRSLRNLPRQCGTETTKKHFRHQSPRHHRIEKQKQKHGSTAHRRGDMRIEVGSQKYRWSEQSNSVRSPFSTQAPSKRILHGDVENRSTRHGNALTDRFVKTCGGRGSPHIEDPKFVISASPTVLHQPQPSRRNMELSFLLKACSPDADEIGSTHVERDASVTCDADAAEEDVEWSRWLNSSSHDPMRADNANYCLQSGHTSLSYHQRLTAERHHDPVASPDRQPTSHLIEHGTEDAILGLTTSHWSADDKTLHSGSVNPFALNSRAFMVNQPVLSHRNSEISTEMPKSAATNGRINQRTPKLTSNDIIITAKPQLPQVPNVQDLIDSLQIKKNNKTVCLDSASSRTESSHQQDIQNEIWKRLILDDDVSEINRQAHEEAREQTKRELLLRSSSPKSYVAGPPSMDRSALLMTPDAPRQHHSDTTPPQPAVSQGSSARGPAPLGKGSCESLIVHEGTPSPKPKQQEFKFHQPRLFVGRLADKAAAAAAVPTSSSSFSFAAKVAPARRSSRGRKARRDTGRPDIRAMPDLFGDPIEETP
ncbi:hypothetical protein S7711_00108 [Stachybotrys chartarum IBT 7711]|uniref:Uncharacterized protein n=1 Tax=Stachybotrys chartarum (strain CBS 109288 / IBT 7711) TaxID=1280523 RepID=A0A084B3G3_STACB|nr:hypothetical protein S7711_00108 [Stachybotrys chartarum IBT 7711]